MENRLVVLKLFLDELEVSSDVDTIDDRKRVQKAIYLGQLTGVDLGYRFSWYLMGPYSPSLTRDYFDLSEDMAAGEPSFEAMELISSVKKKLKRVLPLLKVPKTLKVSIEDWLELVASFHYLLKVSKCSKPEALEILNKEKSHLFAYANNAEQAIKLAGFLP